VARSTTPGCVWVGPVAAVREKLPDWRAEDVVCRAQDIGWPNLSPAEDGIVLREHTAEDVPRQELADLAAL
jgi:hypothetical protein